MNKYKFCLKIQNLRFGVSIIFNYNICEIYLLVFAFALHSYSHFRYININIYENGIFIKIARKHDNYFNARFCHKILITVQITMLFLSSGGIRSSLCSTSTFFYLLRGLPVHFFFSLPLPKRSTKIPQL